jgi:hypothetical protein
MINVNELRIGNNVLDEYGNVSIINTISYGVRISNDKYKWESKSEDQIHPIPLTAELLLECGFEKNIDDFISPINGSEKFFFYKYGDSEILYLSYCEDDLLKIKHLHELQNLYFSLTKTELKIKK